MRRVTYSSFIGVSGFHKLKVQIKYICVYLYYLQQRDLENPDFILFKLKRSLYVKMGAKVLIK